MKKTGVIISIFAILVVTFLAYFPSLKGGFTNWDDHVYLTRNLKVRDLSGENVKSIFTSFHGDLYVPLTLFSFSLEYRLFGLDPRVYHTTNLLLHLANTLLVFWLVLLLSRRLGVSLIAALLFGVHPIHVESVAWITERKDVLYAFFFLGSLIAYLYYLRKQAGGYYYLSLFLFFISLLPKAQGLCLPLVLLLFDYFLGRKLDRRTLFEKAPFFGLAAVFLIIAFIGQTAAGRFSEGELFAGPLNPLFGVFSLVFYLVKLCLPVGLSSIYPFPYLGAGGRIPLLFLPAPFILAAVVIGAVFSGRYGKKVIFAFLFFLFNVLLVLQFVPTGSAIAADRYMYIPSIGFFYLAGEFYSWLYRRKSGRVKAVLSAALISIAVLLSCLTWLRCGVWRDSETLWGDVLKKYPESPIGRINLGSVFLRQGRLEEAVLHFNRALKARPDSAQIHYNLGCALDRQGGFEGAIRHYRQAIEISPDYREAHNNLGVVLGMRGREEEAIVHYRQALRIDPDYGEAHYNLALALENLGKPEEASYYYNRAQRTGPGNPQ